MSASPSLTIYNQDFAVVREAIPLELEEGENEVSTTEITAQLEPESVILRDPAGKLTLNILEQNYRNDPASQDLLLRHFEGREIEFERVVGRDLVVEKGRIVRAPYPAAPGGHSHSYAGVSGGAGSPIIEVDGKLRFTLPGQPLFPALADDGVLKPTLSWLLKADAAHNGPVELSYLSGGFSWAADYNLVAGAEGEDLQLIGWVTMRNVSGRTFEDAEVKLMAGDVKKIQPQELAKSGMMARTAVFVEEDEAVTEKAFDEYHLYTLGRRTTLRDRETKQMEFLRAEDVKGKLLYIYNGSGIDWNQYRGWNRENIRDDRSFGTQGNTKVWVYRQFENSEANGLGIPLPKGRVRFYREDGDGGIEFVGENEIDHTPRNETVKLYTGDAFDIVGERKRVDYKLETHRNRLTESFEIEVRNRKKVPATIQIVEILYRWPSWEITEKTDDWHKLDSNTVQFPVTLQPDEERKVRYTVVYSW